MKLHRISFSPFCSKPVLVCLAFTLLTLTSQAVRAGFVVNGVNAALEANVRALSPLSTTSCKSARWRVERLFREAEKDAHSALRALGHYRAEIGKTLTWDVDCWNIQLDIVPGAPVLLRKVELNWLGDVQQDATFKNQVEERNLKSGSPLDHAEYRSFKTYLDRTASNRGYFDAKFSHSQVRVDEDKSAADVAMTFESGPRYQFGPVDFTQGILRDDLLQGYTDIQPGEPYESKFINELYESLNGSSYFASVAIRTEPLDTNLKVVPVRVELTPAKRQIYSIGMGVTTDTGPHGRLGYADRRINDKGHQFESKLFGSAVRSELNAAYRFPKRDPRSEWFTIVAGAQHEKTDTSEHDSVKVGFSRSKNLVGSWLQTRYVDINYEDFTVGEQSSTSRLIILGSNWETAAGRVLSRATDGYRLSLDIRGASDSLGSDTSFLQLRLKAKWVRSLGERTRFLARSSIGATAKDDLSELPASVRFFAGGDNSVRGYGFETLGPLDENGDVAGGSHQVDISLEIDRLFRDSWAVAAFIDAGDAFDTTDIKLKSGVGVGIRWYSPVGPIRLDLAHPLDDQEKSVRLHLSLGPDL